MLSSTQKPYFAASLQVGSGFDIYGELSAKGVIARIFEPRKAGTREIEIDHKLYEIPEYVHWVPHPAASYVEDVCETRDSFQNKFAVEAGIHAEIGAFSGQVDAAFSREVATSAEHYFCCKNFHQSLGHFDLEIGADTQRLFDAGFQHALERLPDRYARDQQFVFDDFFDDYGTHLTASIHVGGHLEYYVSVAKSVSSNTETIRASLSAEYNSVMYSGRLDAKFENSSEHQAFTNSRHLTIRGDGGDASLIGKVMSANPADPDMSVVAALSDWTKSIPRNPAASRIQLMPVAKLCGRKQAAVEEACDSYQRRKRVEILVEQMGHGAVSHHPTIVVGKLALKPERKITADEMGFQVVILDRTQPTEDVGVVLNKVIADRASVMLTSKLYERLRALLSAEAYRTDKHLLILAGAGMRTDFAPDSETYAMLLTAGATEDLARWVEMGRAQPPKPVSFCHVGIFGTGRGAGMSDYTLHNTAKQWTFRSTAFLYGSRGKLSLYRLGAGSKHKPKTDLE